MRHVHHCNLNNDNVIRHVQHFNMNYDNVMRHVQHFNAQFTLHNISNVNCQKRKKTSLLTVY